MINNEDILWGGPAILYNENIDIILVIEITRGSPAIVNNEGIGLILVLQITWGTPCQYVVEIYLIIIHLCY